MALKMTFVLDDGTAARLQEAATALSLSKSRVVRDAILDFSERIGQLSGRERAAMLRTLDEYFVRPKTRDSKGVDRELREIREARRAGGRRSVTRRAR